MFSVTTPLLLAWVVLVVAIAIELASWPRLRRINAWLILPSGALVGLVLQGLLVKTSATSDNGWTLYGLLAVALALFGAAGLGGLVLAARRILADLPVARRGFTLARGVALGAFAAALALLETDGIRMLGRIEGLLEP